MIYSITVNIFANRWLSCLPTVPCWHGLAVVAELQKLAL